MIAIKASDILTIFSFLSLLIFDSNSKQQDMKVDIKSFFIKQDPLQELSDDVHHLLLSSDGGIAPPLRARAQIAVLEGAAKDAAKNGLYEKAADLQKEADSMWPDVRTSEDIFDIASKAVKHAKVCTRFVLPARF